MLKHFLSLDFKGTVVGVKGRGISRLCQIHTWVTENSFGSCCEYFQQCKLYPLQLVQSVMKSIR